MRKPKSKARKDRERRERMLSRGLSVKINDKIVAISTTWFPWTASGSSTPPKPSKRSKRSTAPGGAGGASASRSTRTTGTES